MKEITIMFPSVLEAFDTELARATSIHPTPIFSPMEASGIIREEFEEFWDEVKKKHPDRNKLREELIQIGAMAARALHDLKLIPNEPYFISDSGVVHVYRSGGWVPYL